MRTRLHFSSMRVSLVCVASIATISLTNFRTAQACTAPACTNTRIAPLANTTVPANTPAFYIAAGRIYGTFVSTSSATLLTSSGQVVPTQVKANGTYDAFLVPNTALSPGTYRIRYDDPICMGAPSTDGGVQTTESAFTVGATTTFPTTLGSVTVAKTEVVDTRAVTYAGSCTDTIHAAVITLSITPSAELAAFSPVTQWTAKVDGAVWATSDFGSFAAVPIGNPMDSGRRSVDRIFAGCPAPPCSGADNGVSLGRHRIEIEATFAGSSLKVPSVGVDVELTCGTTTPDDAGVDAAVDSSTPLDASPKADAKTNADASTQIDPPTPNAASGCAVAPSTRAGGSAMLMSLASLCIAFIRRRRSFSPRRN